MSASYMPAEWEPHRATWLAWPSHAELWADDLEPARVEFVAFCRGIVAATEAREARSNEEDRERLEVLVLDEAGEREARRRLSELPVRFHRVPFGDIWLRDTAPIFVRGDSGALAAVTFTFNGWGEKYLLDGDPEVAAHVARIVGYPQHGVDVVLEGGALEVDGEGTCITTRQCVLNPNRNPKLTETDVERVLYTAIGARHVIWLDQGLANDHTDGHVDTLARFVAPGIVVCMEANDADDPNRRVLRDIRAALEDACDARGRALEVVSIPSPGPIVGHDGRPMPASYLNYYVSNTACLVPTYGSAYDEEAVATLSRYFPGRATLGLSARAILTGGGAFHCITQQEPAGVES